MKRIKKLIYEYTWMILLLIVSIIGLLGVLYYMIMNPPLRSENLVATITEVSICDGAAIKGDHSEIDDLILPNEQNLSVCGRLQINNPPIHMVSRWYFGDEANLLFREVISGEEEDNAFMSTLVVNEALQPGIYGVELIIGKARVWNTEFRVE